jgi:hypothetical protein
LDYLLDCLLDCLLDYLLDYLLDATLSQQLLAIDQFRPEKNHLNRPRYLADSHLQGVIKLS